MNREKSFVKATLIITIGQFCTKMVTFLLLPLYTGILSTSEYGMVDLLNTLVSLLLPIVTFQVEMAVFRELLESRKDHNNIKKIISSGVISVSLQCLVFGIIFFIISPFVHNHYKFYLFLVVVAHIYSSLFLQIARGLGKNINYAFGSFLNAVVTILFNIIFLVGLKMKVSGMLLGTLSGYTINAIFMFFSLKLYRYISMKEFRVLTVKKLWKYSLPLVPNQLSWWIFTVSDRVIVTIFLGLSATGLLSAANKFSTLYNTVYGIIFLGWVENITLHIKDDDIDQYYSKMFRIILNLFTTLAIGMISCMPFIFPILIHKKFSYSYGLIPILIIASLFYVIVSLTSVLYTANRDTNSVAKTSIVSAIINIISHLLLLKFVGLYAAAISTFLAYFIMAINRLEDVKKRYFPIKLQFYDFSPLIILGTFVIISYYLNNFYLNVISLFLVFVFSILLNRKYFSIIIKMILKKKV